MIVQSAVAQHTFYSNFIKNNVVIDGIETKRDWFLADSISFTGSECGSRNKVIVKTLWNKDYLYFLFKVSDKNLQAYQTEQDNPNLFLDDMIEFLIDANNDKDSCWNENDIVYHINLLGIKKDDRGTINCLTDPTWNGNAIFAVKLFGTLNDSRDIDAGYNVEIAVPWSDLGRNPQRNMVLGVNFANEDNNNNGRQLYDWLGIFPLRSPQLFGSLKLIRSFTRYDIN